MEMNIKDYLHLTQIVDTSDAIKTQVKSFGSNPYEIIINALAWMRSNIAPMEVSDQKLVWRKLKSSEGICI